MTQQMTVPTGPLVDEVDPAEPRVAPQPDRTEPEGQAEARALPADQGAVPGRSASGWWTVGSTVFHVHRHDPEGPTRGVVLVVAPPSNEALTTHRTERLIAARVVERGYSAVRVGLSGTSESTLLVADDRPVAARWEDEVVALVDHAADLYGVDSVAVVGTRLAGTLAVNAAARTRVPVRAAVALAPVGSGRQYLRSMGQLVAMNVQSNGLPTQPAEPDGAVPTYGITLDAASAEHLRSYTLGPQVPERTAVHLVAGPDKPLDKTARTYAASAGAVVHGTPGLSSMLDRISSYALVPVDVVAEVVDVVAPAGGAAADRDVPAPDATRAVVVPGAHPVSVEVVDVAGMPGLVTLPDGEPRRVLVWSPGATEPTDGPGGLWVHLARRLAGQGVATVMFDLEDSGERTRTDRLVDTYPYDLGRVEETAAAVRWAHERFGVLPDVGGLCAGAWLALAAAARVPVRTVVPVNLEQWTGEPSVIERVDADPATGLPTRTREAALAESGPGGHALDRDMLVFRARRAVKELVPYRVRVELGRRHKIQAPEPFLDEATRSGAAVRGLLTRGDFGVFRRLHGDTAAARLQRRGRDIVLEVDANTDHGMVTRYTRERVLAFVQRALHDPS